MFMVLINLGISTLNIHFCLGIKFVGDWVICTITMNQKKYIEKMLKSSKMDGCKPMGTPLDPHAKLMKFFDDKYEKKLLQ